MNWSTFTIRVIEHVRKEVRPSEAGGNTATGKFWSVYRDGTRIREPVLSTMPGTVARNKAYDNLVAPGAWQALTDEQKEIVIADWRNAYNNEDKINLQFSDKRAREMYLAGVNAEDTGWLLRNVLT